jgi:hypothetical protein
MNGGFWFRSAAPAYLSLNAPEQSKGRTSAVCTQHGETFMRKIFAKLALAGFIGLTGFGATVAPASADTLTFGIHSGSGVVDVQYRDRDRYGDERDWDGDRRGRGDGWGRERRGRCAPWLAVDKARSYGLRRAHVADVSRRSVVVEGRRRGDYRQIVFANVRGCPVIGR